jgi:EAL domain-containing protein (putative c-di-GMP-specific phosphodiesterase class I)
MSNGSMRIAVQPIVSLVTGSVLGYEALMRPPAPYQNPQALLSAALGSGCLQELEVEVCRKAARAVLDLCDGAKLFVNLTPETFCGGFLRCARALRALPPGRVVVELTEAFPYDARIRAAAALWRRDGFSLAVDDVASGFSRLLAVGMVKPDYLKIDREVVKGVADATWRGVVKGVVALAREIKASVIAEGIETAEEIRILFDLGVEWGQGYLIGGPCQPEAAKRLQVDRAAPKAVASA